MNPFNLRQQEKRRKIVVQNLHDAFRYYKHDSLVSQIPAELLYSIIQLHLTNPDFMADLGNYLRKNRKLAKEITVEDIKEIQALFIVQSVQDT